MLDSYSQVVQAVIETLISNSMVSYIVYIHIHTHIYIYIVYKKNKTGVVKTTKFSFVYHL